MVKRGALTLCALVLGVLPFPARAKWNATGQVRNLWATPVMEYSGLFSDEQVAQFAADVKEGWAAFLRERANPTTRRKAKPRAGKKR